MRTVLIGFGKSAHVDAKMRRFFPKGAHHLSMDPPFNLVGIADRSIDARTAAMRLPRCDVVQPEAADLAFLDPEVAVLAIPPEGRAEVLAALPSVRAVMLEKPLGPPSVREPLLELIEKRKIVTQVAYWRRGDPTLRALPDIGPPQAAFGLYGGGLRNNGSHLVDMVRMLLGEISAVHPVVWQWGEKPPTRRNSFTLDVPGAQVSIHELDFRHYREVSLDIWGERGRIAIENEGLSIYHFPRGPHRGLEDAHEIDSACWSPDVGVGEALPNLYSNLYRALTDGEPLLSPLSSAVKTELVLDQLEAMGLGP
jgi:predicted dehydrogenase